MQTFAAEYTNLDILMVASYDHSITASAKACIKLYFCLNNFKIHCI